MKHALTAAFAIARKDLRSELRSKEATNAAISFALVILLILSFVFEPTSDEKYTVAGGLLWLVFAFSGTLILNRTFARELQNDALEALIAAPVPGWALFLGKAISSYVMLAVVELVSLPVFAMFYDLNLVWSMAPVIFLGTWAIVVVGVAFSALTVNVQLREVMLPLLIYPTLVPALIASMTLTGAMLDPQAVTVNNATWMRLLIGFDIIYTALAVALIDIVLVG